MADVTTLDEGSLHSSDVLSYSMQRNTKWIVEHLPLIAGGLLALLLLIVYGIWRLVQAFWL